MWVEETVPTRRARTALSPKESFVSHEEGSRTFLLTFNKYVPYSLASRLWRRYFFTVIAVEVLFSQGRKCPVHNSTLSVRLLMFVYFNKSLSLLATWVEYVFHLWVQFLANACCFDKYVFSALRPERRVGLHVNICCKKLKCTLVQTLRLCTGRTAPRGSRGIALPFLEHGTRRGWEVSVTPRPLFTPGKTRYLLYRRLGGP